MKKAERCPDDVRFEKAARKELWGCKSELALLKGPEPNAGDFPTDWTALKHGARALIAIADEAREHVRECTACKLASETGYPAAS